MFITRCRVSLVLKLKLKFFWRWWCPIQDFLLCIHELSQKGEQRQVWKKCFLLPITMRAELKPKAKRDNDNETPPFAFSETELSSPIIVLTASGVTFTNAIHFRNIYVQFDPNCTQETSWLKIINWAFESLTIDPKLSYIDKNCD